VKIPHILRRKMKKAKRWWRHGDHEKVKQAYTGGLKTTCEKCDELLRAHGLLNGEKVCPGDWIVEYDDGSLKAVGHIEHAQKNLK